MTRRPLRPNGGRSAAAAVLAAILLTPAAARALSVGGDYAQNRAMGGSGIAVVADNSAIEGNPAGLSQLRRYSIGSFYAHAGTGWTVGASIVDSKTSPLGMGVDYQRHKSFAGDAATFGYRKRQQIHVAISEFYLAQANFGLGYTYSWWDAPVTTANGNRHDLRSGVIVPIHEMLRVGAFGDAFIPFDKQDRDETVGLGIGFSPLNVAVLSVDGIWHIDDKQDWEIAAGLELIALGQIGMRAGYRIRLDTGRSTWSGGGGWFFPKGQVAYAINTERRGNLRHTASFEINVF